MFSTDRLEGQGDRVLTPFGPLIGLLARSVSIFAGGRRPMRERAGRWASPSVQKGSERGLQRNEKNRFWRLVWRVTAGPIPDEMDQETQRPDGRRDSVRIGDHGIAGLLRSYEGPINSGDQRAGNLAVASPTPCG